MMEALAICSGKVPFSRQEAKARLNGHHKLTCPRCLSGEYRWNRYHCRAARPAHWHIGHLYVARGK